MDVSAIINECQFDKSKWMLSAIMNGCYFQRSNYWWHKYITVLAIMEHFLIQKRCTIMHSSYEWSNKLIGYLQL